ncbi:MAG: DUF6512 family protein [Spirochaetota bacterium]
MRVYIKALLYLAIFSILHFGYDLTHRGFLVPLCGIDESIFQHLKMAFWAYLFASIIEYFLSRKRYYKRESFWYTRLLSTVLVPWFIVLIWYLVPALLGRVESLVIDLVWAIFSAFLSAIFGITIERSIEDIKTALSFKLIVLFLFIVSAFLYVWFTYKPPWIDLFVNPELI